MGSSSSLWAGSCEKQKNTNDSSVRVVKGSEEENGFHGLSCCEGCGSAFDTLCFHWSCKEYHGHRDFLIVITVIMFCFNYIVNFHCFSLRISTSIIIDIQYTLTWWQKWIFCRWPPTFYYSPATFYYSPATESTSPISRHYWVVDFCPIGGIWIRSLEGTLPKQQNHGQSTCPPLRYPLLK